MKLKAALIVDDLSIAKWQAESLAEALDIVDVQVILNCENTSSKKHILKNCLYYALNALSLRNAQAKFQPVHIGASELVSFKASQKGLWQKIPPDVVDKLGAHQIDVVIKFGMGLLRMSDGIDKYTVFSFHHGNPSKYRGRPAGFYEMLDGEKTCGIIVQALSNRLDGGKVYAYGESKIAPHSYKSTAINFYDASKYLLRNAIQNYKTQSVISIPKTGKNYTLPSNLTVVKFSSKMFHNFIKRIIYGAFYEKKWRVALTEVELNYEADNLILYQTLKDIPIAPGYNFYADAFFSHDGSKVRLEALDSKTGLGDILEMPNENEDPQVILSGNHYSYPFSFCWDGKEFLLPEVASHAGQFILSTDDMTQKIPLKGLEDKRIVDASLYPHNDRWYLFFGEQKDAQSVLHLWSASSPSKEFTPHPQSPICVLPGAARMGGRLIKVGPKLYRLGQNNEAGYGEALTIMAIDELTETKYTEKAAGTIRIDHAKGPHSLDINCHSGRVLLDYYSDDFSIFAGLRRLKARLVKK